MNKNLFAELFREVRHSLSRFLSIAVIVALGVAFFSGIKITGPDMKLTADRYYDDYRLMDIRLVSTMGFEDEDIKELEHIPEIQGIMPTYTTDALVNIGDKDLVFKVFAIPLDKLKSPDESFINRPKLVEGRYPERAGECLTERGRLTGTGAALGTKIKLLSGPQKDMDEIVRITEYTVVGIVETPYYISFDRGTSKIGSGKVNGFVMIPREVFKMPVYTDVFLTVKGALKLQTYSDEYAEYIKPIKEELSTFGKRRAKIRHDKIISEAQEKLKESRDELESGKSKQKLELAKAKAKLAASRNQILEGEKQLKEKEAAGAKSFADAEASLREEALKLQIGEKEYSQQLQQFNEAREQLLASGLSADKVRMHTAEGELKLAASRNTLNTYGEQLNEGRKALEVKRSQAQKELEGAREKLKSSRIQLEKGQRELEKAEAESEKSLVEAEGKLKEAEKDLDKLDKPVWYVLDRNTNPGYVDYSNAIGRIDAVARVFPLFFFFIAALVCLTTVTRMDDEQRNNIGTLKALGYGRAAIASKYLLYAALASLGGSILGVAVGFTVFPITISNAYKIMYRLPDVITAFILPYAIIPTLSAVLVITFSAWFACSHELRAVPAMLMRPRAPKAGRRIVLERIQIVWDRMNFVQKVTARNLFRYKKRFFMTIIGIGGCTALVLSGFGLKDSIMSVSSKQFDEIYKYDLVVGLKEDLDEKKSLEFMDFMKQKKGIVSSLLVREQNIELVVGRNKKNVLLVVPDRAKQLKDFILLRDRVVGEELDIPENGILMTEKVSKMLKVGLGDRVYIEEEDGRIIEMEIAGITENYVSHYIYMSPEFYEREFRAPARNNKLIAKLEGASEEFEDRLSGEILENDQVAYTSFTTGISRNFGDIISSLNYVVLVLIVSAGALAFVVLYNLTNINVSERIREIATIKVLGFYDKEVSDYVYRENMLLTLIGMVLGLMAGVFLHRYIVVTAEVDYVMFGRSINPISFLYSALLTMFFSFLVNLVIHRSLKGIKMVESLKSVD